MEKEELIELGVDYDAVFTRFQGNMGLLNTCLGMFGKDDQTEAAKAALAAQDWHELERVAHGMKGTSANLGLMDLSNKCNLVVRAVRDDKTEGIDALVADMLEKYQETLSKINAAQA